MGSGLFTWPDQRNEGYEEGLVRGDAGINAALAVRVDRAFGYDVTR